ncbi:hypothetical protein DBR36_01730 [Microbacterium sp. HMWF026]|uniref:hypothetical protein n=1 Tax=Microbacterium sp. HMWF026 TaxID=2056861 RepID=UPI000D38E173|nr:hypothetical protein [Microbacterium sp. HMWF026]PTT22533.1 hypothetical protein DBR36_01730 [Microbacterium sp. HMWF026]
MSGEDYRTSLRTRLRVLLSPWRAFAFAVSMTWFLAGTAISASHELTTWWLGPLSVLPLMLWSVATVVTDWSSRRGDAHRTDRSDRG